MKLKIRYKGMKLSIVVDQVIYIGLFLLRQVLKQFKPYLAEFKANRLVTINKEVKYIFSTWDRFSLRLI